MSEAESNDTRAPSLLSRVLRGSGVAIIFLAAVAWMWAGTSLKRQVLDALYSDYAVCREASGHPIIARLVAPEPAVQAAEEFAADYANLQSSNFLSAPVYIYETTRSHRRLAKLLNGPAIGAGVRVVSVTVGGRGDAADLHPGDRIVGYNGQAVSSVHELQTAVYDAPPGRVELIVFRKGEHLRLHADSGRLDIEIRD